MAGYNAPILPLGIGVPKVEVIGKGYGPLPFFCGIPGSVETIGRGYGPYPFMVGVSILSAPFDAVAPIGGHPGASYAAPQYISIGRDDRYRQALKEDDELLELVAMIVRLL